MPLPRYLMLHPEARLTPQDQAMFCEWAGTEMARLLAEKRKSASLEAAIGRNRGGD